MATAAHFRTGPAQTAQQKLAASPQPQQYDLSPLFNSILGNVSFQSGHVRVKPVTIAEGLALNQEALLSLQSISLVKAKELFKQYLQKVPERGQVGSPIFQVLDRLYDISLVNSSIKSVLVQRNVDLPKLQETLKPTLKTEIRTALTEARKLLNGPNELDQITQVDILLRRLNAFRTLKQFTDADENKRVLDLANLYRRMGAQTQYPQIISDYPRLVGQIVSLQNELTQVSDTFLKLNTLKLQLQKTQAAVLNATKSIPDPLQTRFIDAFSIPFYDAFAWHFWNLVWNSQHEPDVVETTKKIPDWKKMDPNVIDHGILNRLWTNFFPDYDISEWMLITLKTIDLDKLKQLEKELQTLHKNYNQNKENPNIGKEDKSQIQASLLQEMKTLCLEATEPSFSTMTELKKHLTPNG